MKKILSCATLVLALALAVWGGTARSAEDKYSLKVPNGLAFSEFKGYEGWQIINLSKSDRAFAVTLGNPAMIQAYADGYPANGKPFPDGVRMAKIHWVPKKQDQFPDTAVAGTQHDVDFMVKDTRRFADSRSEEHTSELQSQFHLVCRLLLEKKNKAGFTTRIF